MSVTRFNFNSSLTPAEGVAALTDFGAARPDAWSSIDRAHFSVHDIGDNWAEVTEGNASAWERARYEWDEAAGKVDITTHDSKLFGRGGGWTFLFAPQPGGSRVDVQLTRSPTSLKGKLLASLLPLVGPSSLKKSFSGPLKGI
jgi:hypothetical protein